MVLGLQLNLRLTRIWHALPQLTDEIPFYRSTNIVATRSHRVVRYKIDRHFTNPATPYTDLF